MDFGSKYVYKYNDSSEESVSEDEEETLALADRSAAPILMAEEATAVTSEAAESAKPSSSNRSELKRKKRLRKADTNVVSIKFNKLLLPGEMHAGDPVYCPDCGSIASHLSQIETIPPEEGSDVSPKTQWKCEFCPKTNDVDIEQSDLPKKEDATYLIAPAPIVHGSDMTGVDDSIVIFVVDTSGSMSSTTLVQGEIQLPNAHRNDERVAANFDGERMIRNRRQTYVSRLQGVQMAVEANLDKLVKDTPTRRAVLLTFNHEITYYGDGTREEPLVIRGDKLNSRDDILREAEAEQNRELKPIAQTKNHLTERVYDLEEGGQTALGPSILFALSIASQRRGSRIVICTDGLANRGLGNLELAQETNITPEEREQALREGNEYYANMTERARTDGTTISVITIKGTTCLLAVIGQMADGTGGNVNIVDLMNIREEFASILEQKIIATNVEATLIVHRGLYIRDPDQPEERLEKVTRNIGNVTKQSEITFEFGIRKKAEVQEKYQIDIDQLKQLPFQVQVTYTASDGSKALRVLTQLKETTSDRQVAEINARRGVIAENHIRSTADYMMRIHDDDDDEEEAEYHKKSTKWSAPVVQKQRLMYMRKLNMERERNREYGEADSFSETVWNKASSELNSHVVQSKMKRNARKMKESSTTEEATASTASSRPSFFGRVTNLFRGSSSDKLPEPPLALSSAAKSEKKESKPLRSYGFATTKLSSNADHESEELYRFKQFTAEMLQPQSHTSEEPAVPVIPPPLSNIDEKKETLKPEKKKSSDEDGDEMEE